MSETVELPWIDEPVELSEAVEMIAQADEEDDNAIKDVSERVEKLERRVSNLEDGSSIECPFCGKESGVYKAGVGAALFAVNGTLTTNNADVLNKESHVCIDCRKGFTPEFD